MTTLPPKNSKKEIPPSWLTGFVLGIGSFVFCPCIQTETSSLPGLQVCQSWDWNYTISSAGSQAIGLGLHLFHWLLGLWELVSLHNHMSSFPQINQSILLALFPWTVVSDSLSFAPAWNICLCEFLVLAVESPMGRGSSSLFCLSFGDGRELGSHLSVGRFVFNHVLSTASRSPPPQVYLESTADPDKPYFWGQGVLLGHDLSGEGITSSFKCFSKQFLDKSASTLQPTQHLCLHVVVVSSFWDFLIPVVLFSL
jgi:hypothetical protein